MKKRSSLVITGITSLFLIFSVLCLVILSLLTLGTSNSDLAMSKRSMEQTSNYYNTCSRASDLCLEMENNLWTLYFDSTDENDFYKKIDTISNEHFIWDSSKRQLSLELSFTDSQALLICLDVLYPESDAETCLQVNTWQTIVTGTWNPDNRQHIYQGE